MARSRRETAPRYSETSPRVPWNAESPEEKADEPKDGDSRMLYAWRPIDVERVTGPKCQLGRCRNLYSCRERASDVALGRSHGRFSEHDGGDAFDVFGVDVDVPEVRHGAGRERLNRTSAMR